MNGHQKHYWNVVAQDVHQPVSLPVVRWMLARRPMHHQDAAAPASSSRTSRRQTTAAGMYTPELNASEQKRMAGSYNGHNDAGGGSKKPKLSPAPSAAPRASKLLNVTARALTSGGCTRKRARGKVLTIH